MAARVLFALDGHLAICRLPASAPFPSWAERSPFFSITRTADELSIVCRQEDLPAGLSADRGWRCLRVDGTLDLSEVGVLACLLEPLASAGIPVFVLSTFDTDYLLIKAGDFDRAVGVLRQSGQFVGS
jgi:hypothetical protein